MKMRTLFALAGSIALVAGSSVTADAQGRGRGRGMPAEAMEAIHGLFDASDEIRRTVKQTDDGYVSKTVSKNPAVANLLQTHVKQMEKHLKQGMMVRRWDPAYEEFVSHYDDIDIKITNIENGISITTVGKTEDAKKVARNHAGIISKFVKDGWAEHDKAHPAVLAKREISGASGAKPETKPCCLAGEKGGEECAECSRQGAGNPPSTATEKADGKPCCKEPANEAKGCAKPAEPVEKTECCPDRTAAAKAEPCSKEKAPSTEPGAKDES